MLDLKVFGKTILERRKVQQLTQEQLGNEVGVTAQAVSRWENGESAPDIALVPNLCKVLGISADALLGITDQIGIETLSTELIKRLGSLRPKDRSDSLSRLYRSLHYAGASSMEEPVHGLGVNYVWGKDSLASFGLWAEDGIACFVHGAALQSTPRSDHIDALRLFLEPEIWPVVAALLTGPKKTEDLLTEKLVEDDGQLSDILARLIDGGFVIQRREGYVLEENAVSVHLAALVKALGSVAVVTYVNKWLGDRSF